MRDKNKEYWVDYHELKDDLIKFGLSYGKAYRKYALWRLKIGITVMSVTTAFILLAVFLGV